MGASFEAYGVSRLKLIFERQRMPGSTGLRIPTYANRRGRRPRTRKPGPPHDSGTLRRYTAAAPSPGVVLLREAIPIAIAIEELVLIGSASAAEEWIGRLVWIPL